MSTTKSQKWKIKGDVHLEKSAAGLVALSGTGQTLYVCNPSAAHILHSLAAGKNETDICASLVSEHKASVQNAQLAFAEFLAEAQRLQLVKSA